MNDVRVMGVQPNLFEYLSKMEQSNILLSKELKYKGLKAGDVVIMQPGDDFESPFLLKLTVQAVDYSKPTAKITFAKERDLLDAKHFDPRKFTGATFQ